MQVYNTGKSYELNMYTEETDTSEKVEMAETQLYFIGYACDEILDYIEMGGEIEEWYQNKLSKVHSDMEGLHSYIEGEMRRTGMKEEVELDEKTSFNKTLKLPLTVDEKRIIGSRGIYKERYKLDRTQSNYRASKTNFSMPFTGVQDLSKLRKLISNLKEDVDLDEASGERGFKNKATASKGGSRSGQNRWDDAYRKLNVELEKAKKTGDTKKVELLNKKKDDMLDKKYPSLSESELNEKSVSQAQQKLMGMALKYKRGEMDDASDEVKKLASSMSEKDLEDFAKTKHEGLPMKKESITSFKTFTIQEKKKLSAAQLKHMDVDDDNDIDAEDLKQIRNKKKEEK